MSHKMCTLSPKICFETEVHSTHCFSGNDYPTNDYNDFPTKSGGHRRQVGVLDLIELDEQKI